MPLFLFLLLSMLSASTCITKTALWSTHWFCPEETRAEGSQDTSCAFHLVLLWTHMIYYRTYFTAPVTGNSRRKILSELGVEMRLMLQDQTKQPPLLLSIQKRGKMKYLFFDTWVSIPILKIALVSPKILNFRSKEKEENYHLKSRS